jgi:VIT1/CCC1 family predicted Fe2+/Mn2+ transporter
MRRVHREVHVVERIGWLRAAVLGANDGIISTASLMLGVASAAAGRSEIPLAGVAGLVAGAMSMAAGEYVLDTEQADFARQRQELANDPEFEKELAQIYVAPAATRSITAQPSSLPPGARVIARAGFPAGSGAAATRDSSGSCAIRS